MKPSLDAGAGADELRQIPLDSDAAVQARVEHLIGVAYRRQWWMLLLDSENRQIPVIIPMADYPDTPSDEAVFSWTSRIDETMAVSGAAAVIFVWERPGTRRITAAERDWARALGRGCAESEIPVRAQLLCHDTGVRWMAPDDVL